MSPKTAPSLLLSTGEPVTALRLWGIDGEFPVARDQRRVTLGVRGCEVLIPKPLAPKVSSFHALLTRRGPDLWVEDQGSKNGTFPIHAPDGRRGALNRRGFLVPAGGSFAVADLRVLALDDAQRDVLRPMLARCVGLVRYAAIDEAIFRLAVDGPLALVGPPGLDQLALARAIHAASAHRLNPFVEVTEDTSIADLEAVLSATVYVDLVRRPKMSGEFRATLVAPELGLRLIVAAPSSAAIAKSVGVAMPEIALVPLSARTTEIEALLADDWRARGSARSVLELGEPLRRLRDHRWPRNLDELRMISERLLAYLDHGGLSGAARALGIRHQTLGEQLERVGFLGRK